MRCKGSTRREFMQQGGCGLFTLAALGLAADAVALPVSWLDGDGSDNERRYPVPAADGVSIDRGAQVILVRYQNKVFAMALACPHENAAVKWLAKDRRFQCTKHDSQYTPEGTYTSGHATRNLDRFPVRREGPSIVVTVDRVFRSDQDRAGWTAAAVDVTG
jgi:nitrite reductase/ring-hydroxylating ferredoxin subunit